MDVGIGGREPSPHRRDNRGCSDMRRMNPQAAKRTLTLLVEIFQSAGNLIDGRSKLFEQTKAGVGE